MRTLLLGIVVIFIAVSQVSAYDGWTSELSHVAGSAVMAGGAAAIADHYALEDRALIGFAFSTTVGLIGETSGARFSSLDMISNVVGAGIGAVVTDQYILTPTISTGHKAGHDDNRIGILLTRDF